MRMTAIVGKLEPRRRAFLDLVAIAAALPSSRSSFTRLRVRAGRGVRHDAGDGHRELLAGGGAADRPRLMLLVG
jgi:hypothetical protein